MHHLLLLTAAIVCQTASPPKGRLVIVGGGPTAPEIIKKTLKLAGGEKARVLIIPFASPRANAGQASMDLWRKCGAKHVSVLDVKDPKAALKAVKESDLIWMPGGSQTRLMQTLTEKGLVKAIRERFLEGATVGGTSAGAAVMSKIMLYADSNMTGLTAGVIKTAVGLGLCPDLIIDQHYLRRDRRFTRLLCAVLSHPDSIGIGIDECTAVVLEGRVFEVIGKSNIVVIDARKAGKVQSKNGEPEAADNVALHVLKAGMRFHLDKGVVKENKSGGATGGSLLTANPNTK